MSKGSACVCRVTDGSLCSLRGCFIHREHSFLDASHAAFVESSTMWPYACLRDCKVMVKCVESDGKVIATHVSVQSHCQPVRPDRKGCCHPSCVSCMRQRQAADWVHALCHSWNLHAAVPALETGASQRRHAHLGMSRTARLSQ